MTDETSVQVKLSGGDWLKLFMFAVVQLVAVIIWAVRTENRISNLEVVDKSQAEAIKQLSSNGETLLRIDERTKEFDRRFERLERSISK